MGIEIIEYKGSPDIYAWKYPNEEIMLLTQLRVNESQEAVLFKNGKAYDVFGSGMHTLATGNIPKLNKLINKLFDDETPFSAEVWYVNKLSILDIKWGTATPIQLQDPKYGVFLPVRSFGQFGITIGDSAKFLIKLVGTLPEMDRTTLVEYFRGVYITKVKDSISSYLIHKGISALEINAYLDELSDHMKSRIEPVLSEYGLKLLNFYVNDISVPEEDSAVAQLKNALAKRAEMDIIGYSYQQERSFDTLGSAASNTGADSSGLISTGLSLGMGVAVGGAVGGQFGNMAGIIQTDATRNPQYGCVSCGASFAKDTKFCPECGAVQGKTCTSCGIVMNNTTRFCPDCGALQSRKCPTCGVKTSGTGKFCPECGTKL